jgi:hypothetical protein
VKSLPYGANADKQHVETDRLLPGRTVGPVCLLIQAIDVSYQPIRREAAIKKAALNKFGWAQEVVGPGELRLL